MQLMWEDGPAKFRPSQMHLESEAELGVEAEQKRDAMCEGCIKKECRRLCWQKTEKETSEPIPTSKSLAPAMGSMSSTTTSSSRSSTTSSTPHVPGKPDQHKPQDRRTSHAWPDKKEMSSAKKPKMDNASSRVAPEPNPKSEAIEIEGEETDEKEQEEQNEW